MRQRFRHVVIVGLFALLLTFVPKPASASGVVWVSLWTPSSFDPYTEIDFTVDASWPEYWPGDCASEETCEVQYADLFVSGGDEFSDNEEVDFDTSGEWWLSDSWAADRDVGYSAEVDVYWYDWYYDEWFSDYGTDYQTVSVAGPQVSGPDTVWYFAGENPDSTNYPTSITLTSSGGSGTLWSVDTGGSKITLIGTGSQVTISSSGTSFSTSPGDIYITAHLGDGVSPTFAITTRTPASMVHHPEYDATQCGHVGLDPAYDSHIEYAILDQLTTDLPTSIILHEEWTSGITVDWPAGTVNWDQPTAGPSSTGPDHGANYFHDGISIIGPSAAPSIDCNDHSQVDHWGQQWLVGSGQPSHGVCLQRNDIVRFRDSAMHANLAGC